MHACTCYGSLDKAFLLVLLTTLSYVFFLYFHTIYNIRKCGYKPTPPEELAQAIIDILYYSRDLVPKIALAGE